MIRFRIDVTRYKNPLGSIHTILGRFTDSGDVEQRTDPKTKKTAFRWKPPQFVTLDSEEITPEQVAVRLLQPRRQRRKRASKPKALLAESTSEPK